MESVVSLLILSVLLTSVATIILASLRMTNIETENARKIQEDVVNLMVKEQYPGEEKNLIFSNEVYFVDIDGNSDGATHVVGYMKEDGIVSFVPRATEPPGGE